MGALDQKRPTQLNGETPEEFRARSRRDYRFDPGLQSGGTNFSEALKPRLGGLMAQRNPAPQLLPTDSARSVVSEFRGLQNPDSSIAGFVNSLPNAQTASMFDAVSDDGISLTGLPMQGSSTSGLLDSLGLRQSGGRRFGFNTGGPLSSRKSPPTLAQRGGLLY